MSSLAESASSCMALLARSEARSLTGRIGLNAETVRRLTKTLTPQETRHLLAVQRIGKHGGRRRHGRAVIQALWDAYQETRNIRSVGKRYGIHHSAVARHFKAHGFPSIAKKPRAFVIVAGLKYTADNHGYFVGSRRDDRGKPLHKILWERAHGPVPEGMHLIFRDRNKANYHPENIVLVTDAEYWSHVNAVRLNRLRARKG